RTKVASPIEPTRLPSRAPRRSQPSRVSSAKRWAFRPEKTRIRSKLPGSGGSASTSNVTPQEASALRPTAAKIRHSYTGRPRMRFAARSGSTAELKGSKANSGNRTKAMRRIGSDFSSSFFSTVLMGTQLRVIEAQRQVRLQEYVACRVRLPSATFTVRRPSGILVKPGGLQCRRPVDPPIMDGDETGLLRAGPARGGATGERTRV